MTFHLMRPDPQFLLKLTVLVVPTPPGTPLGRLREPLPATGPYRISTYVPHRSFALERNAYFHEWSAGAQPDGVVVGRCGRLTRGQVAGGRGGPGRCDGGKAPRGRQDWTHVPLVQV